MDYKTSGVDIAGGDAWVEVVKRLVAKRGDALPSFGGIGGFSGLIPIGGGRSIAACCDGVGTKLALGELTGIYRGLGQDLVAMSVNDLVTCGAAPLFFLDYIACGRLDVPRMEQVLEGVLDACVESRCALLGGETAEMPGVYPPGGFDLAGFAVGMVDDDKVVDGRGIAAGDVLVGLPSSGVHSNGYSLVRRALVEDGLRLPLDAKPDALGGATLGEALMCPTRVYVRQALAAVAAVPVKAMAHITGGGLAGNIDRTMPEDLACALDYAAWRRPGVFALIASAGVDEEEMRRVFNLGVGYVFIVAEKDRDALLRVLEGIDERPAVIGGVVRKS